MTNAEIINDEDELYRRLMHYYVKEDGKVSSAAFQPSRNGRQDAISVDLARKTTAEITLGRDDRGFRLGGLLVAVPRSVGMEVEYRPQPDNNSHCLIVGEFTMTNRRKLADATRVVV